MKKYVIGILLMLQISQINGMQRETGDIEFKNNTDVVITLRVEGGMAGHLFRPESPLKKFIIPESRLEDFRKGAKYSRFEIPILPGGAANIIGRREGERFYVDNQEFDPKAELMNKSCNVLVGKKSDGSYDMSAVSCKETRVIPPTPAPPATIWGRLKSLVEDVRKDWELATQPPQQ